jgi:SAM-dependent methyltransferase
MATTDTPEGQLGYGLDHVVDVDNYYAWLADLLRPHLVGKVVEHGAGNGALSALLLARGVSTLVMTEPDPRLVAGLRATFGARPGVEVFEGTLEGYLQKQGAGSVDSVLSSNVLEHIVDDEACLRAMHALLRPGGTLALYVPARPELYGDHDREVGHQRRYRRGELRRKLVAAGFEVRTLEYRNLVGAIGWLVMSRILGQKPGLVRQGVRFYDKVVFPVCQAIEGVVAPPYGQNLLAIARCVDRA